LGKEKFLNKLPANLEIGKTEESRRVRIHPSLVEKVNAKSA